MSWERNTELLQPEGWRGGMVEGTVGAQGCPWLCQHHSGVNRLWEERSDLKSSPKLLPHVLAQHLLALFIAQAAAGVSLEVWELRVNCRYKTVQPFQGS